MLLLATAAVAVASWDQVRVLIPALNTGTPDGLTPVRAAPEPLIVPLSSETALDRARALFESGRMYDALRAVDTVRPTDPLRGEADKLKAVIQLRLLQFQTSPGGAELRQPTSPAAPPTPANPHQ